MLKRLWKSVWIVQKKKKWSAFDFEISQSDLASFPSAKVQLHGTWNRQVGYDPVMWLNFLHNVWSDKWLVKLLAGTLTDTSRCTIQFYFANAVSSWGAGVLRGNFHTPMMNKTDGKFRAYGRNDIRYYNYVDQRDSPGIIFSWLAIHTLYEMEVWKQWSTVYSRMRTLEWERSTTYSTATAWWSHPSQFYCLHSGKWWWAIANFRYTHVGITLNV